MSHPKQVAFQDKSLAKFSPPKVYSWPRPAHIRLVLSPLPTARPVVSPLSLISRIFPRLRVFLEGNEYEIEAANVRL